MSTAVATAARGPDFFIVGAPKCGTTALFDYLSQHPNTWCPVDKEPNFFATDFPALQGPKSLEDYLQLFAPAGDEHIAAGEASVVYFYSRAAVPAIRQHYPEARLIVMIRNPVDMVCSFHSQMCITVNEDEQDFARAWALQDVRARGQRIPRQCVVPAFLQYGEIGSLSRYIQAIQQVCPPTQLRIIVFDDLRADPQRVFDEVTDFLGLPRFAGVDFRVVNANRAHASRLVAAFTERPAGGALTRLARSLKRLLRLQHVSFRRALARINTRTRPRPPLTPAFRQELVDYFADEITALEQLTGRDLSHWRQ